MRPVKIFIFLCSFTVFAQGNDSSIAPFYRHLTTPARTLEVGRVGFENFPGATSSTSFAANSVSVGITRWLQIGFVPLFLFIGEHRYNANFKFNVVKEKYFQVGFGYSRFSLSLKDLPAIQEADGSVTNDPYADIGYAFSAVNYREPESKFSFGVNYSIPHTYSNSKVLAGVLNSQVKGKHDWSFDTSYSLNEKFAVTFGFGEMRRESFELESAYAFGYGPSVTYLRGARWFPRLTAGVNYSPSADDVRVLFSFDI